MVGIVTGCTVVVSVVITMATGSVLLREEPVVIVCNSAVMVSSELVVLVIVCVGINTGSAQQEPRELLTHTHTFYTRIL